MDGQKYIKLLDPNLLACKQRSELLDQLVRTKAYIDFTQGLDIRLINGAVIDAINQMRLKQIHFAWDNANEDLRERFIEYAKNARHKPNGRFGTVYVLTNYNSTMEENLYRIYTLRDLGYDPYVMVYDKPHAPREIRDLQRWCNNIRIFRKCKKFDDYKR